MSIRDDFTRLEDRTLMAARAVRADPLYTLRLPGVTPHLVAAVAALHGVPAGLLDSTLAEGRYPRRSQPFETLEVPSGCSVGGGVARLIQDARSNRTAVADHNAHFIRTVAAITSEGSAAGYDSHGISLVFLDLESGETRIHGEKTSGDIDERGYLTIQRLFERVGGLATGETMILVAGAQTRAATQGDNMYSAANAHLHTERLTREVLSEALTEDELDRVRQSVPLLLDRDGPFQVGHNGDVNSKLRWERYFRFRGFVSEADSDSKEIPRIQRIVHECLMADAVLGGASQKALEWLLDDLAAHKVVGGNGSGGREGGVGGANGTAGNPREDILRMARTLIEAGASLVAVSSAVAARLITWADPTSVYVYETLSSLPSSVPGHGSRPVLTLVRGPKAGGMVLYEDPEDETVPLKFASSLSNLRDQIRRYRGERTEEIPVDYITTGARVFTREGEVSYWSLADWQMAEVVPGGAGERPGLRFFDIRTGEPVELEQLSSPIIDYKLRGQARNAVLSASGAFEGQDRFARTVVYDTVLGEVLSGPTAILHKQIKGFRTEEPPTYAVDNQYGAEILLSAVTLLRNTRRLFSGRFDASGRVLGEVVLRPEALFKLDEPDHMGKRDLRKILERVGNVVGLGEGTSRNILGMAFSAARLEGLDGAHLNVLESNLARTEALHIDAQTLCAFVSNSGSTKPVVALAEETLNELGEEWKDGPYVWAVTNLVTSELSRLASKNLGASVTNLPWEKAVGSTFAAFSAFQDLLAMLVYMHEIKGRIGPGRSRSLYRALADFPRVARATLSFRSAQQEIRALAQYMAGNSVDIAYVGCLQGYDAAEGALKFAEMMQHPRVKFYSGAYEQHGQRATYLRSLRANPGTLVILHVPNLETSIGSWMAQLISEDRPRAGKIAVICAQEDALRLKESGADFVIAAPEGTTDNIFTDTLTKLLLDNMLTEATIEESNRLAGRIRNWGEGLLERAGDETAARIPSVQSYAVRVRNEFLALTRGGRDRTGVQRMVLEMEHQVLEGNVTLEEREARLAEHYVQERQLSLVNEGMLDRVLDLLEIVLTYPEDGPPRVFFSLLNDLVLEFSDRSLAMRVVDEKFRDDPGRARVAVHYQGMAKVVGANPIKPDNIAKFQQGWGIPSFLLPPGQRMSFPVVSLKEAIGCDGGMAGEGRKTAWQVDAEGLRKAGFSEEEVARIVAFGVVGEDFDCAYPKAVHLGRGRYQLEGRGKDARVYPSSSLEEIVLSGESRCIVSRDEGRLLLEVVLLDPFGDPSQVLIVTAKERDLTPGDWTSLTSECAFLSSREGEVRRWLSALREEERESVLARVRPADYLVHSREELRTRVRDLAAKAELISEMNLREEIERTGLDLHCVSVENLETLRNVSRALTGVKGSAIYDVVAVRRNGKEEHLGQRRPDSLRGEVRGTRSSFDEQGPLRGNKKIAASGRRLKMGYGKDRKPVIILPAESAQGEVDQLLLMHPQIDDSLDVEERIRMLGKKYHQIANHVSEFVEWQDHYLGQVKVVDLLMLSDEEIADDHIVPMAQGNTGEAEGG